MQIHQDIKNINYDKTAKRGADMGNKTLEQKNTNKIGDYFWRENAKKIGGFSANLVGMEYAYSKCSSQCIQNGKQCPIYNTCIQRK